MDVGERRKKIFVGIVDVLFDFGPSGNIAELVVTSHHLLGNGECPKGRGGSGIDGHFE
jgi:hypothetical protein